MTNDVGIGLPGSKKSVEEILNELTATNELSVEDTHRIRKKYSDAELLFKRFQCTVEKTLSVTGWVIDAWNLEPLACSAVQDENEPRLLAILARSLELYFPDFKIHSTQLLSVVLFTLKPGDRSGGRGRLLQVKTGEGKSHIVALTAAFAALMYGSQVDVVTSAENLAKRDADRFKAFFQGLGLKSGHNISSDVSSYKDCNILFGTVYMFACDWLHDYERGTKDSEREKRFLIVDEVDSMLIDSKNGCVRQGSRGGRYADPDALRYVRNHIWMRINQLLLVHNGVMPPGGEGQVAEEVKTLVQNNGFSLKRHESDLALLLTDRWCNSAVNALLHQHERKHYVIMQRRIIIIDQNTGELCLQTRWSYGLHEFLELKHGLATGHDNLTSVYYSYYRFFTEYETIWGMTGTLGSKASRKFLHEVYKVDSLIVPKFRHSQFHQLPTIVVTAAAWKKTVVERIVRAHRGGQPVLAIFESLKEVETIHNLLQSFAGMKVQIIIILMVFIFIFFANFTVDHNFVSIGRAVCPDGRQVGRNSLRSHCVTCVPRHKPRRPRHRHSYRRVHRARRRTARDCHLPAAQPAR